MSYTSHIAAQEESEDFYQLLVGSTYPLNPDEPGHNDAMDAFRHAYVSGVYAMERTEPYANILGWANEIRGDLLNDQPSAEKNMDLWNNKVGRDLAATAASKADLAQKIATALGLGDLILNRADPREFGEQQPVPTQQQLADLSANHMDALDDTLADRVVSAASATLATLQTLFGQAETARPDPLVLDLNGNGEIDLNPAATVYFDTNGDSYAEAVNWVAATDGLLARDVNENGNIDNNGELFGNATQDGFSILSSFDLNTDGVINASDAVWGDLAVWQDANQNGYSESGELLTLSSLGIQSINLGSVVNTNESGITHNGTVTTSTGTMRISNVLFEADFVNTRYVGDYTLDIDTLFLPTLRGHGTLADLHIAASMDVTTDSNGDTIKDKLAELAGLSLLDLAEDVDAAKETIRTLLYHWAGVEDAPLYSRGTHMPDARPLMFLEQYLDREFVSTTGGFSNPGTAQMYPILSAFNKALSKLTADIFVQIAARELFEDAPYNFAADGVIAANFVLSEDKLEELSDYAVGLSTTSDRSDFWEGIAALLEISAYEIKDAGGLNAFGLTSGEEAKLNAAIEASDALLTWYEEDHGVGGLSSVEYSYSEISGVAYDLSDGGENYTGTLLDDRIIGGNSGDIINASEGDDFVNGGYGNDSISGGLGNDTIDGDGAYYMHGNDTIDGGAGNDAIEGGKGDDTISGGDGDDQLRGDGTGLGTTNNDTIDGGLGNDILEGDEGDDVLIDGYGTSGQNLMDGGLGYTVFRVVGGGAEVWIDGGQGRLEVPAAYTDENDLTFERIDNMLHITGSIPGSEINVYVTNQFPSYARIDVIKFASGYELNVPYFLDTMQGIPTQYDDTLESADTSPGNTYSDNIHALGGNDVVNGDGGNDTLYGDAGNDTLNGGTGSDVLHGNDGNDALHGEAGADTLSGHNGDDALIGGTENDNLSGGAGDDTYTLVAGDGADTINESANEGFDTVVLSGIDPGNVRLWSVGGGGSTASLSVVYSGTDSVTITGTNSAEVKIWQKVEQLAFDGGITWDLTGNLTLTGSSGNDTGYGTGWGDVINGLDGNDTIHGGGGEDMVYGGIGNDTLNGNELNDTLYGEDGTDTLNGNSGNDTLIGGVGDDNLTGGMEDDTFVVAAGAGVDTINEGINEGTDKIALTGIDPASVRLWSVGGGSGTASLNVIYSATDSVKITGTNSAEVKIWEKVEQLAFDSGVTWNLTGGLTLTGTSGNDTGYGTGWADVIHGLGGTDTLNAGGGADTVYGGDGADTLNGSVGNDMLYGGTGNDTLNGNEDNDALYGEDGTDTLNGNNGADILTGGIGNDTYNGGAGDDTYVFAAGDGADTISDSANEGFDTVALSGINSANVRLWSTGGGSSTASLSIIYSGSDTVKITGTNSGEIKIWEKVEQIAFDGGATWNLTGGLTLTGTSGNETGYGTGWGDVILGLAGNDTLNAGGGADTVYGDDGTDTLNGSIGNDTLYGGLGNDALNGNEDNDTLHGEDGADTLNGNSGTDALNGGAGNDSLIGGDGSDVMAGGDGADYLWDGAGGGSHWAQQDFMDGEAGDDGYMFLVNSTVKSQLVITDASGTDGLWLSADFSNGYNATLAQTTFSRIGNDDLRVEVTVSGTKRADVIIVDQFTDLNNQSGVGLETARIFTDGTFTNTINLKTYLLGYAGAMTTYGTAANDVIDGILIGNLNDTIYAGGGNDTLSGDAGTDSLYGEAGNDNLKAGEGGDMLYGGADSDTFIFDAIAAASNTIADFSLAQNDKIDISQVLEGYDPLTHAITDFVHATTSGANTILEVDANGGGNSFVQIATISGVTGLEDEAALLASGHLIAA
jgi:Ca2+-binding RTX toxin-like protein